jgi:ribosome maturation factor RimP
VGPVEIGAASIILVVVLIRAVAAILDVEDPIDSAYKLEVSSPGNDRPLTRQADFDRYAGVEVRIETGQPVEGRRPVRGRLLGSRGESIALVCDDDEIMLPFAEVQKAKLVLTDELIAASQQDDQPADEQD